MAEDLHKLAASIERLSHADQLRLAAGLLDHSPLNRSVRSIARTIVERVSTELGAVELLDSRGGKRG